MGIVQSIFFRPQRGYRKYKNIGQTNYNPITGEVSADIYSKVVEDTLYQLDGVISETHSSSAIVTQHPVEYGVNIADHVIKQPQKIVVNGVVTNSPSVGQLFNRLPGGAKFGARALSMLTGSRVREAYAGLVALQNERKPIRLQTGLLVYDNMVLTDISAPNDLEGNLKVTLTFTEVFVVDGKATGVTQGVLTTPTAIDKSIAIQSLVGFGLITAYALGVPNVEI